MKIAHLASPLIEMPSIEKIDAELATVKSMDDFFGKEGVFAKLFSKTLEAMLEAELTSHLGYGKHEVKGNNTGDSRNGSYSRSIKTSSGKLPINIPRDRSGTFKPKIIKRYQTSTNELEDKITAMYAKGTTTRDIKAMLQETYGMDVSTGTITAITDKIMPLVVDWQSRPLESIYPIIFLDAIHLKMRVEGKIKTVAIYIILGVDLRGHKDILGHWVSDGAEGANFWLEVITDLKNRGVEDILIACMDGLIGFSDAIRSVYPDTQVQRCIIHQIRNSLKYISWKDKDAYLADLKQVYGANTKVEADMKLELLKENWGKRYTIAIKSWENNWEELSTFFQFTPEIRKIMYTTNSIESYNRQLRKVTKSKGVFPTKQSAEKMLYLAYVDIKKKWDKCIPHWPTILNQLMVKFEGRIEI